MLWMSGAVRRLFVTVSPLILACLLAGKDILLQILWARTHTVEDFLQSLSWIGRLAAWRAAWEMIVHNPLTGVGPGLFRVFYPQYDVVHVAYFLELGGMNAHNLFLNVCAETGVLALVGVVGLFAVSLWTILTTFRSAEDPFIKGASLGLFAGLTGFLVNASLHGALLVQYTLDAQSFFGGHTYFLFIILGLGVALRRLERREANMANQSGRRGRERS
jgi:O-antigen ligase